ncbi:MmgE/PrpD family protein [Prosthecomicrobium sp. N25]|uniref:MmgE/PrpD family protein n=1 Tax=Prosthecomicrobium sp. N25 TaxID=3129254 RepID=UPI003078586F
MIEGQIPVYRDEIAEHLAAFTVGVSGSLSPEITGAAKRVLGDSIAVSLGALDHPAARAARRHVERFPVPGGQTVWGSTVRTTPELAALANGVLLRCYDYNDFFVGRRNSGHPSDIVAGVIACAEWTGASGAETLSALAVGYEVVAALFDAYSTAPGGWDYTNLVGPGATAAFARLLKLDETQAREAYGMTVIPHFASDEVESCELNRRGDLTMWKRFNGSDAVRNALQAALLASVGVEAAVRPFTGKMGFSAKLQAKDDPLPILRERLDASRPLGRIAETYMKLWPVGSVGQSAIRAALEARAKVGDVSRIKEVRVFSEEGAYHHLVELRQDPWNPISRETADHSMPYIVGAAVLDGYIHVDSFARERVLEPSRRAFVRDRVKVVPAPELGTIASGKLKRAEDGYLSRVEIETVDGVVHHGAAKPFPGHPKAPFSEADLEEKLHANAAPYAGRAVTETLARVLFSIEEAESVKALTSLMAFDESQWPVNKAA